MNNRNYFIFAVTFALAVPIIIGGSYFYKLYNRNEIITNIAHIYVSPELIAHNNAQLKEVKIDLEYNENPVEFYVTYIGEENNTTYNIYLKDININNTSADIIKWKLALCDSNNNMEKFISEGDFSSIENNIITLKKDVVIYTNQKQNYRLYYYIENNAIENNNDLFSAKITIEKE